MVMQVIQNPPRTEWNTLLSRPSLNNTHLREKVQQVLGQVKQNGDDAVRNYTKQFDGVDLSSSAITRQAIDAAEHSLAGDLQKAIQQAAANIRLFHEKQLSSPEMIETMPGIQCWRRPVGIEKVGLYIPGGSAPLFSTILMLAIPAAIAGCKEVVLCSPPGKRWQVASCHFVCGQAHRHYTRVCHRRRAGHCRHGLRNGNGAAGV